MTANTNRPPAAHLDRITSAAFLAALDRMGRSYHGGATERAADARVGGEATTDTPDTTRPLSGPDMRDMG